MLGAVRDSACFYWRRVHALSNDRSSYSCDRSHSYSRRFLDVYDSRARKLSQLVHRVGDL